MGLTQAGTDGIKDDAISLAKMASGTDGQIITYDASGNPTAVGPGTDGQVLTSTGAGSPPAFETISSSDTLSFRNIAINGACNVAQRATSGTGSGYLTVDRWTVSKSADEDPTQSQHALTSSDTGPWAKGFRNSFHITNGNNSSNTGGNQAIWYEIEAQDIRNSGWDYTNTSDYLTISYWVKTSVAQTFYGYIVSSDGTSKRHAYSLGSLSANTWTKITKSFPGHADLQFDDNANTGLSVSIYMYAPPAHTDSGVSLTAWANHSGSERMPDFATTWWQTNDATFEVTGLQIEATGSSTSATDFEHRSYADELQRCLRYYWKPVDGTNLFISHGWYYTSTHLSLYLKFPVTMRATPTGYDTTGGSYYRIHRNGGPDDFNSVVFETGSKEQYTMYNNSEASGTAGQIGYVQTANASAKIEFSAEL